MGFLFEKKYVAGKIKYKVLGIKLTLNDKGWKERLSYCPVCRTYEKFRTIRYNDFHRDNAVCPKCGSLERHRFLYFLYQVLFLNRKDRFSILHMAPEECLYRLIVNQDNIEYVPIDLNPEGFPYVENCQKEDVRHLSFPDNSFDYVLSNQIMEHIDDEQAFIKEILRVLKTDGILILNIPYKQGLENTFEDKNIQTEEDRIKYYYQVDHVRLYGEDTEDRIKKLFPFARVERISEDFFGKDMIEKMHLSRESGALGDMYFLVRKL